MPQKGIISFVASKAKAPSLSERRLLGALVELEREGYLPSMDGLVSYLRGDPRLSEDLPKGSFYGSYALSHSSKSLKGKLRLLLRKGLIKLRYEESLEDYALLLQEEGRELALKEGNGRLPATKKALFVRVERNQL